MHCRFRVQQMFLADFLPDFTILAVPMVICCCTTAIVLVCVQGKQIYWVCHIVQYFISALIVDYCFNYLCPFTVFIAVCSGTTFNAIISSCCNWNEAYQSPLCIYLLW